MKNEESWRKADMQRMNDVERAEKTKKKIEEASSPYTVIAGRFEFKTRLSWSPYK